MATLMYERFNTGDEAPRGSGSISLALREWRARPDKISPAAIAGRDRLVRAWVDAEVDRLTRLRAATQRQQGVPGPEGSVGKLSMATVNQATLDVTVGLLGAHGMLYPSGYQMTRPETMGLDLGRDAQRTFLRVQANSIEGGTSDIMRTILGERVLGLPGEPRVDKDLPWADVPRS
jgi:hypothetical protein